MTDRGKHSRQSGSQFYKDVLLLIVGILIVGALVFGGLSLLAGDPEPTAAPATSAEDGEHTTSTSQSIPPSTSPSTLASTPTSQATSSSTTTTTAPTTTSSTTTTTEPEARPVNDVTVIVLNSIGVDGLAGALSTSFAERGYVTLEAANYQPTLDATTVFHAEGFALEAAAAAEVVPDESTVITLNAELAEEQNADVVVVIGQSYEG